MKYTPYQYLTAMGACNPGLYDNLTPEEAWLKCASEYDLDWLIDKLEPYISERIRNILTNAFTYGFTKDNRTNITKSDCFNTQKCLKAMRDSIGFRTILIATNKFMKDWRKENPDIVLHKTLTKALAATAAK